MGYYSRFNFYEAHEYKGQMFQEEFSDEVISFLNDNKDENSDWEDLLFAMEESCKFYECERVMCALSEEFPDKLFNVYREGEESGDIESSYYKNGKTVTYKPQFVWPEFKEEDLK